MIDYNSIQTYPELVELLKHFDEKLESASAPAEETIWDNEKLCKELNISPRTAAYWRSSKLISYSKINGLIFYKKSDVLDLLKRFKIEAAKPKIRIR